MNEMTPFDIYEEGRNPYGAAPVNNVMAEARRHESGNAVAANAEARAVAEVKAQVLMARQFPRDPLMSMENILRECERPTLADKAVYTYPRGKETVSGPSIRLAEMLARNWGNCTFGLEVLERKTGCSILRAFAWDLETNTYISRQFELKHWRATRTGGYALTDDRDIYELEANMGSRRMRACILQMIPGDVTQAAVDKCRMITSSGLIAAMNDPEKRRIMIGKTVKVFEKIGISADDLEEYLGCKRESWNADHALRLKELKNGLDEGALSIGDVFKHLKNENQNARITKKQVEELMELAAATSRQGEISRALKEMGISKIADTPLTRHEEVKAMIMTFLPVDTETGEIASSDA